MSRIDPRMPLITAIAPDACVVVEGQIPQINRRASLAWLGATGVGLAGGIAGVSTLWPATAQAGAQREEDLSDSIRGALSSAIASSAPPIPVFVSDEQRQTYQRWLQTMSERLARRKPDQMIREEFLQTVWYEAHRAGLDVSLVLGLIQVESAFRKYAISIVGARGYMQVMPFWTRAIGDGDAGKLFHMQTNLRFGCVILRYYFDREGGNLYMALGRYNGSRGKPQYPNAVFAAQKNWLF